MTHCSTARAVFKTRPRVGRATFTTVLSRMTMKVPRMIAMSGTSTERVLATEETAIDIHRHCGRPFYCRPEDGNRPAQRPVDACGLPNGYAGDTDLLAAWTRSGHRIHEPGRVRTGRGWF